MTPQGGKEAAPEAPRRVGPLSEWTADRVDEVLDETVGQLLDRQLPAIGARPALYWVTGEEPAHLTFAELAGRAGRVAAALSAVGAADGERVAVWGCNSVDYVVLEYACALAGSVLVPLNTAWTDAEVSYAVQLTRPVLFFAGVFFTGDSLVERAAAQAGTAAVVRLEELDAWAGAAGAAELPVVVPDQPLLIQFTSGTTGRAKGAVISHRGALNGALQRNVHDANPPDDVWLNPVPYFHIGGSCFVILGGLLSGGAFVVLQRWVPDQVLRLMRSGLLTRLGGVPTMLVDILDGLAGEAGDAGIHSVSLGGATVQQHLVDRIRAELGAPTLISYGQSECPLICSTSISDDPAGIGGTVGRPLPGAHVRLVNTETGELCRIGEPGELLVRSPNVMLGYWGMPEETAETITEDGLLRTGDLGEMDERGYITFRGRSRDVIIRGGENIYPAEIEEHLVQHPGVASAVLVGLDDKRLGEQVVGVVVRTAGSEVTGDELAEFLRTRVARFKVPVAWRFVDGYPMTASGKVRRFVVREQTNRQLINGTQETASA